MNSVVTSKGESREERRDKQRAQVSEQLQDESRGRFGKIAAHFRDAAIILRDNASLHTECSAMVARRLKAMASAVKSDSERRSIEQRTRAARESAELGAIAQYLRSAADGLVDGESGRLRAQSALSNAAEHMSRLAESRAAGTSDTIHPISDIISLVAHDLETSGPKITDPSRPLLAIAGLLEGLDSKVTSLTRYLLTGNTVDELMTVWLGLNERVAKLECSALRASGGFDSLVDLLFDQNPRAVHDAAVAHPKEHNLLRAIAARLSDRLKAAAAKMDTIEQDSADLTITGAIVTTKLANVEKGAGAVEADLEQVRTYVGTVSADSEKLESDVQLAVNKVLAALSTAEVISSEAGRVQHGVEGAREVMLQATQLLGEAMKRTGEMSALLDSLDADSRSRIEALRAKMEEVNTTADGLLDALRTNIAEVHGSANGLGAEVGRMKSEYNAVSQGLADLREILKQLQQEAESADRTVGDITALQTRAAKLQVKCDVLSQELEAVSASARQSTESSATEQAETLASLGRRIITHKEHLSARIAAQASAVEGLQRILNNAKAIVASVGPNGSGSNAKEETSAAQAPSELSARLDELERKIVALQDELDVQLDAGAIVGDSTSNISIATLVDQLVGPLMRHTHEEILTGKATDVATLETIDIDGLPSSDAVLEALCEEVIRSAQAPSNEQNIIAARVASELGVPVTDVSVATAVEEVRLNAEQIRESIHTGAEQVTKTLYDAADVDIQPHEQWCTDAAVNQFNGNRDAAISAAEFVSESLTLVLARQFGRTAEDSYVAQLVMDRLVKTAVLSEGNFEDPVFWGAMRDARRDAKSLLEALNADKRSD